MIYFLNQKIFHLFDYLSLTRATLPNTSMHGPPSTDTVVSVDGAFNWLTNACPMHSACFNAY